jgi:RNA polymerase sigma factor (sigma-70 family)
MGADVLAVQAVPDERDADIEDVVSAAIDGDPSAWAELVRRYTPQLWRTARSYRLNHADAAEVLQITWLRMVENLGRVREPGAIAGWLSTTARRESVRIARGNGRVALVAELPESRLADHSPPADDEVVRRDLAVRLRTAVGRLPAADQRLLGLLLLSPPLSYREVARRLNRPTGSIGPTRARCLARLRDELASVGLDAAS